MSYMNVRCNVCSLEIDEKDVQTHVNTSQHKDNKAKISKKIERGSDLSVVNVWLDSIKQ